MSKQTSSYALLFCCFLTAPAMAQGSADMPLVEKKLIEYGWDVPFPDFVRENIRANLGRERSPVQEWTLWSPSIFHFLEPENFGVWVFK